jgi:hypothetical protein
MPFASTEPLVSSVLPSALPSALFAAGSLSDVQLSRWFTLLWISAVPLALVGVAVLFQLARLLGLLLEVGYTLKLDAFMLLKEVRHLAGSARRVGQRVEDTLIEVDKGGAMLQKLVQPLWQHAQHWGGNGVKQAWQWLQHKVAGSSAPSSPPSSSAASVPKA